jgi:hypothetical protein
MMSIGIRVSLVALLIVVGPRAGHAQWLPPGNGGVSIGAGVGAVNLEGAVDSHPPAGHAGLWSLNVSVPLTSTIAIDGEFTRSGIVESSSARVARPVFRERRRDAVAAVYARIELWRKGVFAVAPVAGFGLVKPTRQVFATTLDLTSGAQNEYRLTDADYPVYPHTWAFSWGCDVTLGSRHVAVVPGFRAHEHFANPSPWLAANISRTVYGSVGVRYTF